MTVLYNPNSLFSTGLLTVLYVTNTLSTTGLSNRKRHSRGIKRKKKTDSKRNSQKSCVLDCPEPSRVSHSQKYPLQRTFFSECLGHWRLKEQSRDALQDFIQWTYYESDFWDFFFWDGTPFSEPPMDAVRKSCLRQKKKSVQKSSLLWLCVVNILGHWRLRQLGHRSWTWVVLSLD